MELELIKGDFSVNKIDSIDLIDFSYEYVFVLKTPDEITLVCETAYAPPNARASEPGWNALRISGILDFALIGVLAKITCILAEAEISVFAVSTYNTDYILLKAENLIKAVQTLIHHGYVIK